MKLLSTLLKPAILAVILISFTGCEKDQELNEQLFEANASVKVKAPTAEVAGNNLSFPVIWAEGIAKSLRTAPDGWDQGAVLTGKWWYVWGPEPVDPQSIIYSCEPSPSDEFLCIDQTEPGTTDPGLYKGWVQKDAGNFWEAYNANAEGIVNVDFIDWGDNLESIDWSIQSQVRTELVLYKVMPDAVLQYPMRHVSGWGITEVHGLQTDLDGEIQFQNAPGDQATVYSTHTRMTIQKLNVERDDSSMDQLVWDAGSAQWIDAVEDNILVINEPILSNAISGAADGPGFFNAEVNVKGKIMYGYTWDLKKLNEGTGDYRITYSFDATAPNSDGLNTFLTSDTQILVPIEEEEEGEDASITGEGESGGVGILDAAQNLTYMDIRIIGKTTGGGGGNSGGGGGRK